MSLLTREQQAADLEVLGYTSLAEACRAHTISINTVSDRWLRPRGKRVWSLLEALTVSTRSCTVETRRARWVREERERSTGVRECATCHETHPLGAHKKEPRSSLGLSRHCASCRSETLAKQRYGVSRQALWSQQKGHCRCCDRLLVRGKGHIEHNHHTGEVRGLCCPSCNWAIGHFREKSGSFRAAINWVESPSWPVPDLPAGPAVKSAKGGGRRLYCLWRDHSMAPEDLQALFLSQEGRCGICKAGLDIEKCAVDHDHDRRALLLSEVSALRSREDQRQRSAEATLAIRRSVRGVLCHACNRGLGHVKESRERLACLATFLGASPAPRAKEQGETIVSLLLHGKPRTEVMHDFGLTAKQLQPFITRANRRLKQEAS